MPQVLLDPPLPEGALPAEPLPGDPPVAELLPPELPPLALPEDPQVPCPPELLLSPPEPAELLEPPNPGAVLAALKPLPLPLPQLLVLVAFELPLPPPMPQVLLPEGLLAGDGDVYMVPVPFVSASGRCTLS